MDEGASGEDVFWGVVDFTAAIFDGVIGVPLTASISNGVQAMITAKKDENQGLVPNPRFISNGQDEVPSPRTHEYLKGRKWKSAGANVVAVAGAGLSTVSLVDVGGIAQHTNATGSTLAHMQRLVSLGGRYKESKTITEWIALIVKLKAIKAGMRGAQLAGSSIPIPAVGAVAGALSAAAKLGVKVTYTKVCLATASEIHWRAFAEQRVSGFIGKASTGKVGPATEIVGEIFTRRGLTRAFGQYDFDAICREPCGWMALSDKLLLL